MSPNIFRLATSTAESKSEDHDFGYCLAIIFGQNNYWCIESTFDMSFVWDVDIQNDWMAHSLYTWFITFMIDEILNGPSDKIPASKFIFYRFWNCHWLNLCCGKSHLFFFFFFFLITFIIFVFLRKLLALVFLLQFRHERRIWNSMTIKIRIELKTVLYSSQLFEGTLFDLFPIISLLTR